MSEGNIQTENKPDVTRMKGDEIMRTFESIVNERDWDLGPQCRRMVEHLYEVVAFEATLPEPGGHEDHLVAGYARPDAELCIELYRALGVVVVSYIFAVGWIPDVEARHRRARAASPDSPHLTVFDEILAAVGPLGPAPQSVEDDLVHNTTPIREL